jgi:hypothetical protein
MKLAVCSASGALRIPRRSLADDPIFLLGFPTQLLRRALAVAQRAHYGAFRGKLPPRKVELLLAAT